MSDFIMPVGFYMTTPVHTAAPTDTLERTHRRMEQLGVSSLPVVDDKDRPIGVISRTDLLRAGRVERGRRRASTALSLPQRSVGEVMTERVISVRPRTTVEEAAARMLEHHVHRVYVVEEELIEGVLGTQDLMYALHDRRVTRPVSDFMSAPVRSVEYDETLAVALERLSEARISGLVVVEGDRPVGIFAQEEALAARDHERDVSVEDVMSAALVCVEADTPMYRAAEQASTLAVRRLVVVRQRRMEGVLSGLDFARAVVSAQALTPR